jgi:hypothetical protein
LRRAGELLRATIRAIACDTTLWSDDVWVGNSTPVECGRSRQTAKRSDLAGWVQWLPRQPFALVLGGLRLLRPARKGEPERAGARLFRPLRQLIESVNQTFKGQLDLERHGGHTPIGSRSGSCNASSPDRGDLAQRQDRTADPTVADRL